MKTRRSLPLFALLLLLHAPLSAQQTAGLPGAFLRIGAGARALGLGGAFSAIADDPSAAYWNAAGLSQLRQIQLTATYYRMSLDRSHNFVAGAIPVRSSAAVGLAWIGLNLGGIEARTGNTAQPDFIFSNTYNALLLSVAQEITPFLSIGATVKGIYQKLYDTDAFGTGFDASLLLRPMDNVRLGFTVQDIATKLKWGNGRSEAFPLTYRGGIALNLTESFIVSFDAYKIGNDDPGFSWGAEYRAMHMLPLRLGYSEQGFVGGAGVEVPLQTMDVRLDYAYGKDQLDGSESHKLSLGIAFHAGGRIDLSNSAPSRRRTHVTAVPPLPDKAAVKNNRQVYLRVLAKGLNVRNGPGVRNKRIAVIYKGQEFKKITASGYWYKIELAPGQYGWVHHKYVKEVLK